MSVSGGRIPQEIIDEIASRVDIVDVVSRYVPLKKHGANYTGLCPFHNEKTPSFSVSPSKQIYHCFGCGAGGNVFKFLMEIEHMTFPEAVRKLADEVGVRIPERQMSENDRRQLEKRQRLLKWNDYAVFYYQAVLRSTYGKVYQDYLDQRQIRNETRDRFELGACLEGWDGLYRYLKKKGARDDELIELGLVSARSQASGCYDRFRDRLIFPIRNAKDQVIAFGGRIIDKEKAPQKYLNSPDSVLFHKGGNVYGINLAKSAIRSQDRVVIVEGYMDVISCHQAGITNVVAPLGTALTEQQIKMLMRYTYNFVTSFDGDAAGIRATQKSIDLIENLGGKVKILTVPDQMDPDEYIKAHGVHDFQDLIDHAEPSLNFRVRTLMQTHSENTIEDKLEIVNGMVPYLLNINNPLERSSAVTYLSEAVGLTEQAIREEMEYRGRRDRTNMQRYRGQSDQADVAGRDEVPEELPEIEKSIIRVLPEAPELIPFLEEHGGAVIFRSSLSGLASAFIEQFKIHHNVSPSRLDDIQSALFARACSGEDKETFLQNNFEGGKKLINQLQYEYYNYRYDSLLRDIRSTEQGSSSEKMLEMLSELEMIRQQKTALEKVMRGDNL